MVNKKVKRGNRTYKVGVDEETGETAVTNAQGKSFTGWNAYAFGLAGFKGAEFARDNSRVLYQEAHDRLTLGEESGMILTKSVDTETKASLGFMIAGSARKA